MFRLWSYAEQDLLSEKVPYRLRDTGQGLNRVQASPKTSRMMHAILHKAQTSVGGWVGSSVIHMGDHNVPNALMFIGGLTFALFPYLTVTYLPCRQVFPNLPHPPAHLYHSFSNSFPSKKACLDILHRRTVWQPRRSYSRNPL
jgi:hypothetical protein